MNNNSYFISSTQNIYSVNPRYNTASLLSFILKSVMMALKISKRQCNENIQQNTRFIL